MIVTLIFKFLYLNVFLFILDCLRKSFKTKISAKENNCTLPWIKSMEGDLSYKNAHNETCKNDKDFYDVFLEGLQFSKVVAQYNSTKCPGILIYNKAL